MCSRMAGQEKRHNQGRIVPWYDVTDILGHIICAGALCSIGKSLCVAMKHNGNDVKILFFSIWGQKGILDYTTIGGKNQGKKGNF